LIGNLYYEAVEKGGNISLSDQISAYAYYLKDLNKFTKISTLLKYRRLYKNYMTIAMGILRKKYPIEASLRNGDKLLLRNELEAQIHGGRHDGFEYDTNNDIVTISMSSHLNDIIKIQLHGGISNGDIRSIFVDNIYQVLPVKGKTVIDIGANIADSSIYFALRGASKVVGYEPFPKNFKLAQKNIKINSISDKITVYLAGCAADNRNMIVDPDFNSGGASILKNFREGIKIPVLTLENILNHNDSLNDDFPILKMDCEGCEYETIVSADKYILQKFSHMMIEYHYGYKNLKEKIEKSGFKVLTTRPKIYTFTGQSYYRAKLREGYITAERY
jgi:FkbM family methyltransferase